ncbi:hypothetical protein [Pontibacter liquoris]|uniref:hypothetical protein n=1 Tax=Pontibacter liquoris TaxID=2905677 RepID=UPI001FA779FA|nr:hypothetical protein [Pontibacter liquoris]
MIPALPDFSIIGMARYGAKDIYKLQKKIRRRYPNFVDEGHFLEDVQYLDSYADYTGNKLVMRLLKYSQPNSYGIKIFDKNDYLKATENGRL